MELIYIVLIFIVPGLLVKKYDEYKILMSRSDVKKNTIYEELFNIVAWSILVSGLTLAIVKLFGIYAAALYISELIASFNNIYFLIVWSAIATGVTIVLKIFYEKFVKNIFFNIRNKHSEDLSGVKELGQNNETVWERIFFNKEVNQRMFASIYKDGNYITSGMIDGWNAGKNEKRELRIIRSTELERIKAEDKERTQEEKWLKYTEFEYFDPDTGVLIKFYDQDELMRHWDKL